MPLPFHQRSALVLPAGTFSTVGLSALTVHGARYGGDWVVGLTDPKAATGEIETSYTGPAPLVDDPAYPQLALETAFVWLKTETIRLGLRLVLWESHNHKFPAGERPFFCLARAVVANAAFVPAPGVTYADQMTLDLVMAASTK